MLQWSLITKVDQKKQQMDLFTNHFQLTHCVRIWFGVILLKILNSKYLLQYCNFAPYMWQYVLLLHSWFLFC